jgi:hypothetical protein
MFSKATSSYFDNLPDLDRLDPDEVRQIISAAYIDTLETRADIRRVTGPDVPEVRQYLRRLANALESSAAFDEQSDLATARGCAFVAAEAISLLSELILPASRESYRHRLEDPRVVASIEAGLLYLRAQMDPAAGLAVRTAASAQRQQGGTPDVQAAEDCCDALVALCRLDARNVPPSTDAGVTSLVRDPAVRAATALYERFGAAIGRYLAWLSLQEEVVDPPSPFTSALDHIILAVRTAGAHHHASIHHLAILARMAIVSTAARAVRSVEPPTEAQTESHLLYIANRVRGGSSSPPRLLLWPTAEVYAERCLPGPRCHAVVSVPTGSGKSHLAEIAVAQAALSGWVLYLVPTNALAAQVRDDLANALEHLPGANVRSFLGEQAYLTLEEELVSQVTAGTVAVMTPEKCALALRLSPDAFQACSLCVFDECHLVGDGTRGALAELVVSHLIALNSSCRFLLMSAMLGNPGDLAGWLADATNAPAEAIDLPWRPTQTMRGIVGVDSAATNREAQAALDRLSQYPPHRVRERFLAQNAIVASLQGTWASNAESSYALIRVPTATNLAVSRRGLIETSGWVNATVTTMTSHFASHGIRTLAFLPANKHHPFSVANEVTISGHSPQSDSLVEAYLAIAEYELGLATPLRELIVKGVGVHTAAMLDSERRASEIAYARGLTPAMIATGTLAQGLNLPAEVVVIGGTVVGDRREAASPEARHRVQSQLLNAIGRAGRPGVANHGVGLVVTDKPLMFRERVSPRAGREAAEFLVEEEDSTNVSSRLSQFVRAALAGDLDSTGATPEELVAISYLPLVVEGGVDADGILRKTLAIHTLESSRRDDAARRAGSAVRDLGTRLFAESGAPEWIATIVYRTGLSFFLSLRLAQAFDRVFLGRIADTPNTISEWIDALIEVLSHLPPSRIAELLSDIEPKAQELVCLWNPPESDDPNWTLPPTWTIAWAALGRLVKMFVQGAPITDIARVLDGIGGDVLPARSAGKPIPRTLMFIAELTERLARSAGAIGAICDLRSQTDAFAAPVGPSLESLRQLPLALRYGCDSTSTLSWFRFGIRHRRAAHFVSRVFPIPSDVTGEGDSRLWIRSQIRDLDAANELPLSEEARALLRAVRLAIL